MRSHLLCLLYFAIRSCRGVNIDEQESDVSGSVVGGGIRWRNLSVSLFQQKKGIQYLVEPSSGFIQDGHVTAVIGPSGAGKSSFLAALSGTTPKGSSKTVSGSVWRESQLCTQNYERYPLSITSGEVALLQQHDTFFNMLTPRETINLAAFLQLDIDRYEREDLVDNILDSLGLRSVESRKIGDQITGQAGNSGSGGGCLSGGERRRLSVALELVSDPKVILADEPTSGLDSAQAKKVFDIMAKAARRRNIPCICSMHQPRASIWKELDSFILLAPGGKVIYMGDRKLGISYFAMLGYKCPPETTPAEFFIDLVTIDTEDEAAAKLDKDRIDKLAAAFQKKQNEMIEKDESVWDPATLTGSGNGLIFQKSNRNFHSRVAALLLRSLRQNFRDVKVNILRGVASLGLAKLFSELFSKVKQGESIVKGLADRPALISFGVINMTMMAMMKTINLFGREKNVVTREQLRRHYTSFDYLISKSLAEIPLDMFFSAMFAAGLKHFTGLRTPFLRLCGTFSLLTVASASLGFAIGSFTNGVEEAMTVGMPLMVVLMAVGIINPSGVDSSVPKPWFIRALKQFSPIGMAIEALCVAEFKGMRFDDGGGRWRLSDLPKMGGLALVQNGDQVLEALALDKKTYGGIMNQLAATSAFNLLLSWVGLAFFGPSFTRASTNNVPLNNKREKKVKNATTKTYDSSKREAANVPLARWFS